MKAVYRQTQIAWVTLALLLVFALPIIIAGSIGAWPPELAAAGIFIAAAALALSAMTITVNDEGVEWHLTFGLFGGNAKFDDITDVGTMKLTLFNGLGIRVRGRDILWSVGASSAVVLELRDRRMILGSPDAEHLAEMIYKHTIITYRQ